MTPSKIVRIESSLNSAAQAVLEAVPIQEAWSLTAIVSELKRQGRNPDLRHVDGCLNALVDQKLVRQPEPGHFTRVSARAPAKASREELRALVAETHEALKPKEEVATGTLDKLAELAKGLRAMSLAIAEAASQIDDVALEVEGRLQQIGADSAQLQELRKVLRSIGGLA
jgi:hypothetical protein